MEYINEIVLNIIETLKLSKSDILNKIIEEIFKSEFHSEIFNRNSVMPAKCSLSIKGAKVSVNFIKDSVDQIDNPIEFNNDIIYIDDPYVLDDLNKYRSRITFIQEKDKNHRDYLTNKLERINKDEIEVIKIDKKLKNIFDKLEGISLGKLFEKDRVFRYKNHSNGNDLDIRNIATGLKVFIIIRTLLENGTLSDNGIIVFDEPEIHLQPKRQVALAELIVLIQKEFNMHILLNTHSPYFLRAIEVFTDKYEINKSTKYYLSYTEDNKSILKDVTKDTEDIYKLLVDPLDKLEEELNDES